MVCPKCGSNNVSAQVINETRLVNKHHGIFWWLCIGWWWVFVKWFFFTVPALIFAIFVGKRKKVVNKQKTMCVCQDCGHTWRIK
jgi:predicted nucleic-acid-binding Zn-ribbon protein